VEECTVVFFILDKPIPFLVIFIETISDFKMLWRCRTSIWGGGRICLCSMHLINFENIKNVLTFLNAKLHGRGVGHGGAECH